MPFQKGNKLGFKHGLYWPHRQAYGAWANMIDRCVNPKNHAYNNYGGRGIGVCKPWFVSFLKFLRDMGDPPPGTQLDRRDNNKGYSKANCRWIDRKRQNRNRRNNRRLTMRGVTMCVTDWAEILNIPRGCIWSRLALGWTVREALETPVDKSRQRFRKGKQ